ncbi:hypothetical protein [Actinomadura sp. 9N215]|uniref:hypothetical protein n=1 Tax=Actinomadura sp. 9N215 TaxID=3375150 RepID=UPI003796A08E
MYARFVANHHHEAAAKRKIPIVPALILTSGAVVGGAARMGLPPSWATAVTGALAVLVGAWAVLVVYVNHLGDPLPGVDWSSADDYEQRLVADLRPVARTVLTRTQDRVRRRLPAAEGVHVYCLDRPPEHQCALDTTGCDCARTRLYAAVLPNRRHPIILVGDRLLEQPTALAYALAHEAHHVRRPWRQVAIAVQLVSLAGWLGMGLILPPRALVVAAPTVWMATLLLNWISELAADAAASTAEPDAARGFWRMLRAALPAPTGRAQLTTAVIAVLGPTHPPMALRAALAARIARHQLAKHLTE